MAFSNSFPPVDTTTKSSDLENEMEMSVSQRQTLSGNKWASVPTLPESSDAQFFTLLNSEIKSERESNSLRGQHHNIKQEGNVSEKPTSQKQQQQQHQQHQSSSTTSHIENLIDLEDCPCPSNEEISKENMDQHQRQISEENKEMFEFDLCGLSISGGPNFYGIKNSVNSDKTPNNCEFDRIENQNDVGAPLPMENMERNIMMVSSFDDNGNPLDFEAGADEAINVNANHHNIIHLQHPLVLHKVENKQGIQQKGGEQDEEQDVQLPASVMSMSKSSGSENNNKLTASSEEHSEKGEFTNPIKLGFKSSLQKSVEGFIEECKYFINAAALSEDIEQFTMPSLESDFGDDTDGKQEQSTNNLITSEKEAKKKQESSIPTVMVKPRVPISKSFPDIIQTHCFVDDDDSNRNATFTKNKIMKAGTTIKDDSSCVDLAADSLEELPTKPIPEFDFDTSKEQEKHTQYDFTGNKRVEGKLQDLMDMSQSQSQIGILAEDQPIFAPEAWTIDFNSLSMELESSCLDNSEMSSSIKSSNPNSLAFFIDIDEPSGAMNKNSEVKSPDKKKIFSMFVDFGKEEELSSGKPGRLPQQGSLSNAKPSRLPVHRNISNIKSGEPIVVVSSSNASGTASSSNKKRTFQYPSPILQHKAAVEAAKQAIPTGNPDTLEKPKTTKQSNKNTSYETEQSQTGNMRDDNVSITSSGTSNMEASSTSNRSSLHVATDFDMMASFISSMEVSGPEAEVCSKGPCFKLGKDLLRMFEDGINTDVSICVNGRYLKAHKCILSSRSQYFAAIFSGPWIEKAGNIITLDGFSYNVVHFTMCHIYSGTNEIPDSIDLLELATLTDLLGLEGLRENISQTIRVKFCHNFHRPCTGCITGVLECFPIAISYEMDELHRKMTKWICKHFVRIWPTKAFANLGDELIEKCLRYSVNHLSVENILDISLGCDQLLTTMPSVRWTEPIFSVVNQLSEACTQFIGEHFNQVVQCQRFHLFGKGQQWNISRIEGTFMEAMTLMKTDEACLSHAALSRLIELGTHTLDEVEWSTVFVDFLKTLAKEIEKYLIANGSKAVLSKYWEHLGQDVRKRICTSSFVGYDKAGNKIVKGTTTGATNTGAGVKSTGHGRLTPSDRSSSISSVKSSTSSTTKNKRPGTGGGDHHYRDKPVSSSHANSNEAPTTTFSSSSSNYSTTTKSSSGAKIASVRPIQNVLSTNSSVVTTPTTTELPPPTTTTMPKNSKSSQKISHHQSNTTSSRQRGLETREKSFNQSPRNSVASSSSTNRTPVNSQTPITPSKPGPGLPGSSTGSTRSTRSSAAKQHNSNVTNQVPPQPTKTYLTNSARANAVSKPNLRPKSSSKKVTEGENNIASISGTTTTTNTNTGPTSRYTTPRTPNLSQPSRYASSHVTNRNSRSSISGSDSKSERASTVTTPVEPLSRNSSGRATGGSSANSNSSARAKRVGGSDKMSSNRNSSGSSASSRKTSGKTQASSSHSGTGMNGHHQGSNNLDQMDPYRDSQYANNIMSKSTIETDTGEPKMRTLAEIGRSSTFSKDEPTILGKLDPSQTLNIDFTT